MENNRAEKGAKMVPERQNGPAKSFLAVGPTLHYSHKNVQRCWWLALVVFSVSCALWSKVVSGSYWGFTFDTVSSLRYWCLGQSAVKGVSIFEYPWQILVLGLIMGIAGITPVLISQLMSLKRSLPFVASGMSSSSFSVAIRCDCTMHGASAYLLGILRGCQGS